MIKFFLVFRSIAKLECHIVALEMHAMLDVVISSLLCCGLLLLTYLTGLSIKCADSIQWIDSAKSL